MGNIQNAINSSLGTGAFLANQSGMLDTVKENRDIKRQNNVFEKNRSTFRYNIHKVGKEVQNNPMEARFHLQEETLDKLSNLNKENTEAQKEFLQRASMRNSKYTQMMVDNFLEGSRRDMALENTVKGRKGYMEKITAKPEPPEPQRPSDYNAGIEEQTNKMVAGMNPPKTMSPNDMAMYKAAQDLAWEREKRANSDALFNFIKQQAKGGIE